MSIMDIQEKWSEIQNGQSDSANIESILHELESLYPEVSQFSSYDMECEEEESHTNHLISLQKWGLPRD